MAHFIAYYQSGLDHYGLLFVFFSIVIENMGIPFPTEFAYLASVHKMQQGTNIGLILFILTLGHVCGSVLSYVIGQKSHSLLHKKFMSSSRFKETHHRIEVWYRQQGIITVFVCRFVGYVRPWASFVAGLARFPFWTFLFLTSIGSLIFSVFCLLFSQALLQVWNIYPEYRVLIVFGLSFSFLGLFLFELFRKHRRSRRNSKQNS
jgi:membrane protein DedA with SNARE-associated domain